MTGEERKEGRKEERKERCKGRKGKKEGRACGCCACLLAVCRAGNTGKKNNEARIEARREAKY